MSQEEWGTLAGTMLGWAIASGCLSALLWVKYGDACYRNRRADRPSEKESTAVFVVGASVTAVVAIIAGAVATVSATIAS